MRKCRKMISVIMLMVMLVSLLPSGALAAEAPSGSVTEEATAPEEVQNDTVQPDDKEDSKVDEDTSSAEETDEPTDQTHDDEMAESSEGDSATFDASEEEADGAAAKENSGIADTEEPANTENAAVIEPTNETVANDAMNADSTEIYLNDNGPDGQPYIKNINIKHRESSNKPWVDYEKNASELLNGEQMLIDIDFVFPAGTFSEAGQADPETPESVKARTVIYQLPEAVDIDINGVNNVDVTNSNDDVVGKMNIDASGKMTIVFFKEFATPTAKISGTISFTATANKDPIDPNERKFGFDGYTGEFYFEEKNFLTHDISVTKSDTGLTYNESDGSYTTTYIIEVSTFNGTLGKVKVEDVVEYTRDNVFTCTFGNPTVKKAASSDIDVDDAVVVPESGYTITPGTSGKKSWTIENLDALNAGEKYYIIYDAKIEQTVKEFTSDTHSNNDATTITNTVKASDDEDSSEYKHELSVYSELKKSVRNVGAREYRYNILINKNCHDLTGYTLTDELTDGAKFAGSIFIKSTLTQKTKILSNSSNKFSYVFRTADWSEEELNNAFDIQYDVNATGVPYETTFDNKATLTKSDEQISYIDWVRVKINLPATILYNRKYGDLGQIWRDDKNQRLRMSWRITQLALPNSMEAGGVNGEATFEDTAGIFTINGADTGLSSYFYANEVLNALAYGFRINEKDGFYKFDYVNGGEDNCTFSATGNDYQPSSDITFTLIGYDLDGEEYDLISLSETDAATIKLARFKFVVKANRDLTIAGETMSINQSGSKGFYSTYVDCGDQYNDIVNCRGVMKCTNILSGGAGDSFTGGRVWQWNTDIGKRSKVVKNDDGVFIDYQVDMNLIFANDSDWVTITDTRSFDETKYSGGVGTYVPDSCEAEIYKNKNDAKPYWASDTLKKYLRVIPDEDNIGVLKFQLNLTG